MEKMSRGRGMARDLGMSLFSGIVGQDTHTWGREGVGREAQLHLEHEERKEGFVFDLFGERPEQA